MDNSNMPKLKKKLIRYVQTNGPTLIIEKLLMPNYPTIFFFNFQFLSDFNSSYFFSCLFSILEWEREREERESSLALTIWQKAYQPLREDRERERGRGGQGGAVASLELQKDCHHSKRGGKGLCWLEMKMHGRKA